MMGETNVDGGMPAFAMVGSSFGGVACDAAVAIDMLLSRVCGSDRLHGKYSRSSPIC